MEGLLLSCVIVFVWPFSPCVWVFLFSLFSASALVSSNHSGLGLVLNSVFELAFFHLCLIFRALLMSFRCGFWFLDAVCLLLNDLLVASRDFTGNFTGLCPPEIFFVKIFIQKLVKVEKGLDTRCPCSLSGGRQSSDGLSACPSQLLESGKPSLRFFKSLK